MNQAQLHSFLRWLLSASGPGGALLIYWGLPENQLGSLLEIIIALVAVLPSIGALVLSIRAHTKSNTIAATEAMPEVQKVLLKPAAATSEMAAIAMDPMRPKVQLGDRDGR